MTKTKILTLWVLYGGKNPSIQRQRLPLEHIVTMLNNNLQSRAADFCGTYFVHEEDARAALAALKVVA